MVSLLVCIKSSVLIFSTEKKWEEFLHCSGFFWQKMAVSLNIMYLKF